jgi:membrane protein DedA with SNARE-associated domain/membrane-associated phospholipid phosphatase
MEVVQYYQEYLSQNPEWAIAVVFLIAFGEALLIIGLFVPSTVALFVAGALVGMGQLPFWPVFLATAIGAIAGDQISYWVGRWYGEDLKTWWPLNRYPDLVKRGEDYVRQHGGKSIAIGRFIPGVKAVVPGIVGMLRMNQAYFVTVNVTSGIVWAAVHVLPGVLLGQSLLLAAEFSGRLVVLLVILLILLAIAGWTIRLVAAGLSPLLNKLLRRISNWARRSRVKPLQQFGRVLSPGHPQSYLTVLFFFVCVAGLLVFADMVLGLLFSNAVSNLDVSIRNVLVALRSAPADALMVGLSMLADDVVLAIIGAAIVLWLMYFRAVKAGVAAAATMLFAKLCVVVLSNLTARARPETALSAGWFADYSFPSNHMVMSTVVFGLFALLASQFLGRWSKALVASLTGIVVITVGFAQLYLGTHWASDMVAGLLLGTTLVAAYGVILAALPARRIRALMMTASMLGVFGVVAALYLFTNHDQQLAAQARVSPKEVVALTDIPAAPEQLLPKRRIDLTGQAGDIFSAQWVGNLDGLGDELKAKGWTIHRRWEWKDSSNYFGGKKNLKDVEPRPLLHEGLQAAMTASLNKSTSERLVLRAFQTNVLAMDGGQDRPVFMISVLRERLTTPESFNKLPETLAGDAVDLEAVLTILGNRATVLRSGSAGTEIPVIYKAAQ